MKVKQEDLEKEEIGKRYKRKDSSQKKKWIFVEMCFPYFGLELDRWFKFRGFSEVKKALDSAKTFQKHHGNKNSRPLAEYRIRVEQKKEVRYLSLDEFIEEFGKG